MSWIETYTHRKVNPFKIKEDDINISDIAHSLSMLCRFNGHCHEFYCVADHSIRCLELFEKMIERGDLKANHGASTYSVSAQLYLYILLHDAEEAYTSDLPRPIKQNLADFVAIGKSVSEAVFNCYGITRCLNGPNGDPVKKMLKHIDAQLLATEARDLGMNVDNSWSNMPEPLSQVIVPRTQQESKREFIKTFERLWR